MSQERVIHFSLQHNFLVKHPYENMVSFVTHVKRIGKAIFLFNVYVSWAFYLFKTSSNTRKMSLSEKYSLLLRIRNFLFIPDIYDCDKN